MAHSNTNTPSLYVLFLFITCLVIALFALVEARSDNANNEVSEGYIPVKQNGKFVNSVLFAGNNTLKSAMSLSVPDKSLLVGGVKLTNGGTSIVSTASGRDVPQYFVVSELEADGSTAPFQWKFGESRNFPPLVEPNIVQLSDEAGVFEFNVNVQGNNLFSMFSYIADRKVSQVNLQIFINNDPVPIYDYFRAFQAYFSVGIEQSFINLGYPVFFEQDLPLKILLTNQDGTQFGLYGDNFGNTGFLISSASERRAAEKITFTDTQTTIQSALTQFDIYVKVGSNPVVADGSSLNPFADLQTAFDAATEGATICAYGPFIITEPITLTKSLSIVGTQGVSTYVQYESYDNANGAVMTISGTGVEVSITNMRFSHGQYGLVVNELTTLRLLNVEFYNNGWNGDGLSLALPEALLPSGWIGYDSSEGDKQAFASSDNVRLDAAGLYVSNALSVLVEGCKFFNNVVGVLGENCTGLGLKIRDSNMVNTVNNCVNLTSCVLPSVLNVSLSNVGGPAIIMNNCSDATIYNTFARTFWGAVGEFVNCGNTRINSLNSDDTNRTLVSAVGHTMAPEIVGVSGNMIPAGNSFILEMDVCILIASTTLSVAFDRVGIMINEIAEIDDITNVSVNINNVSFKNIDTCIYLGNNSITNSITGLRAARIILGNNVFNNADVSTIENVDGGDYYELPFANQITILPDTLDASIDNTLTSVTLTPGNLYSVNQLFAYANDTTYITIVEINTNRIQMDIIPPEKVTINGATPADQSIASVVNELNALFSQSGGTGGTSPVITSSEVVNSEENQAIVYDLRATNLGGVYWTQIPAGLAPNISDIRRLEGVIASAGSYEAKVTLSNAFGAIEGTITFIVATPLNTKSTYFRRVAGEISGLTPDPTSFPLYRLDNNNGTAWSVSCWFYNDDRKSDCTIWEYAIGGSNNRRRITLTHEGKGDDVNLLYGWRNEYIEVKVNNQAPRNQWNHIVVTYDGGTTGEVKANVNDYYSRFNIYINDTKYNQAGGGDFQGDNKSNGFAEGFINASTFVVGRGNGPPNRGFVGWIDELSMYTRVLNDAEVTQIYNSGDAGVDLVGEGLNPTHWWQMGDGSVYPASNDNILTFNMVLYDKLSTDIQNFVAV